MAWCLSGWIIKILFPHIFATRFGLRNWHAPIPHYISIQTPIRWNIHKNLQVKENDRMEKKTFSIPNISCGHCVMAIKNELSELDGINLVAGNPEAKSIDVEWEAPITEDKIKETLKEINYPAA